MIIYKYLSYTNVTFQKEDKMVIEFNNNGYCLDCGYKPGDLVIDKPQVPITYMPDNCPNCDSTNIYRPPVAKDRKTSPFKKF